MKVMASFAALWTLLVISTPLLRGDEPNHTPYPRRNPIVEAVQKTKEAIVTIKAARPGAAKDTIGTGVIIDERGYIVTNRHVIGASKNTRIGLHDGTELAAELVWARPPMTWPSCACRPTGPLHALELAPVGDLMVGETVIAVGHPYGYTDTVSTGIISALDREITMPTGATLTGSHPNQCRHQSRQLGRPASQYQRRIDRYQRRAARRRKESPSPSTPGPLVKF